MPAPHEQYLWDGGFHWGEWLEPGASRPATSGRSTRVTSATATCTTLRRSRRGSGGCSVTTTKPSVSTNWPTSTLDAWRTEYIDADGSADP